MSEDEHARFLALEDKMLEYGTAAAGSLFVLYGDNEAHDTFEVAVIVGALDLPRAQWLPWVRHTICKSAHSLGRVDQAKLDEFCARVAGPVADGFCRCVVVSARSMRTIDVDPGRRIVPNAPGGIA